MIGPWFWALLCLCVLYPLALGFFIERSRKRFGERCRQERLARDAANPHRPPSCMVNLAEYSL